MTSFVQARPRRRRRRSRSGRARRARSSSPAAIRSRSSSSRGGEVVVDEPREVLLEQLHDREGEERRHERRALLEDVAAVLDRADDRGVRRRPPDPALLERAHERRLGVASGRRGRVAVRARARVASSSSPSARRRQAALVVVVRRLVVAALLVGGEEAAEGDHGAGGAELGVLARGRRRRRAAPRPSRRARPPSARRACAARRGRRARARRAFELARRPRRRPECVAGGPDRLVRLLRVLHLALPAARLGRDGLGAEQLGAPGRALP